jgi:hypothetical protein
LSDCFGYPPAIGPGLCVRAALVLKPWVTVPKRW